MPEPKVSADRSLARALRDLRTHRLLLETPVPLGHDTVDKIQKVFSHLAGVPLDIEVRLTPRLRSGLSLHFGHGRKVCLDFRVQWLHGLEERVRDLPAEGSLDDLAQSIKSLVAEPSVCLSVDEMLEVGTVIEVGDGIARVVGLGNAGSQELLEFGEGFRGIAFDLRRDSVGCLLLEGEDVIEEGAEVRRTHRELEVPVGENVLGRIINALGQPIDGKGPIAARLARGVEKKAPGVTERQPVTEPLYTGIKLLDALVPIGRGQRELIIGDRQIGKTTMALDIILSQTGRDVVCIYVAVGQKASSVARAVGVLETHGAMEHTVVVAALSDELPAFRFYAPYTGCAIGEHFMEKGRECLIVYDDLSKHAVAYREISSLLRRPVGREAYPGDIFYVHSSLLERAAKLSSQMGGGSLTAIPIVETLGGDVSAFIPTNVISICDGQIYLEAGLFNEGFRPAMNVGLSVSRVGGAAQVRVMKKVAGRLRIDLAQYHEMATFVKFGAELDEATQAQLDRGERGRELLKQAPHLSLGFEKQAVVLYAVANGFMSKVPVALVDRFESELYVCMEERYPAVLQAIRDTGDLSEATEEELKAALGEFTGEFLRQVGQGEAERSEADRMEKTGAEAS